MFEDFYRDSLRESSVPFAAPEVRQHRFETDDISRLTLEIERLERIIEKKLAPYLLALERAENGGNALDLHVKEGVREVEFEVRQFLRTLQASPGERVSRISSPTHIGQEHIQKTTSALQEIGADDTLHSSIRDKAFALLERHIEAAYRLEQAQEAYEAANKEVETLRKNLEKKKNELEQLQTKLKKKVDASIKHIAKPKVEKRSASEIIPLPVEEAIDLYFAIDTLFSNTPKAFNDEEKNALLASLDRYRKNEKEELDRVMRSFELLKEHGEITKPPFRGELDILYSRLKDENIDAIKDINSLHASRNLARPPHRRRRIANYS